jgi:hypothetical protein
MKIMTTPLGEVALLLLSAAGARRIMPIWGGKHNTRRSGREIQSLFKCLEFGLITNGAGCQSESAIVF